MKHQNFFFEFVSLTILIFCGSPILSSACDQLFDGFGVFLGSIDHFANSPPGMVPKVFDYIYNDLRIRHFRTSYPSTFSPAENVYQIACCTDPKICTWIEIHNEISKYVDTKFMASIWSPPSYMKLSNQLPKENESGYYYFIKNVTLLIQHQFGITIERVSPINEPENIFATYEHTEMEADQLCRMVRDFNDPLVSVCPENAYYWTSLNYANTSSPSCLQYCQIFGTHGYELQIFKLKSYYDLIANERIVPNNKPIWFTEVSSTFDDAETTQMREALDMAINIANFVGYTCVERYYYWLSYTLQASGEALIWGNNDGSLRFPKKYFAYKHFTLAAYGGSKTVNKYDPVSKVTYLTFGDSKAVFINNLGTNVRVNWVNALSCVPETFCCTTNDYNWNCSGNDVTLLNESVCSCDF